jgi:hypothetical protein
MTTTTPNPSKFTTLAETDLELTTKHLQKLQLHLYTVNKQWPTVFVIEKYPNRQFILYDTNGNKYKFLLQNNTVKFNNRDLTTNKARS